MSSRQIKDFSDVVVVSGLPRSGTSMLMKMLVAGGCPILTDEIRSADEDNPKGYFEFEPVKDMEKSEDRSWLERARGKAVKIVSPLLKHLPSDGYRYRVLFMRRNMDEILASQRKMLQRRGEPTDATDDGAMFDFFMKHLSNVQQFLEVHPGFSVCFFHYRETIESPQEQAERLDDFLELGLDRQAMAAEVDSSLYRNRA